MLPGTITTDSDLVTELIATELGTYPESQRRRPGARAGAARRCCPASRAPSRSSLMDENHVIGVRDPNGFRPLCLGRLDHGWVLASESPALDVVGAHFVRELEPGEMVVIDADGLPLGAAVRARAVDPKLCLFEFVYFARPDTRLYGQSVHQARVRMGEQLAAAGAGRGRHGDGRARVRPARRRGLRPAPAASPTARAWSRTATSAARSSPPTRRCGRSACA